jgi:phosphomannomutase
MSERVLRISHVGLRGVVGPGLTAKHVLDFAAAFGTFLEPPATVVLGRDPRASGRMIREGAIAALLACGHEVVDLGIGSTPVVQHTIRRIGASGGISIGASHNAAEWNALKFLGRSGTYLSTAEASELLDIYHLKKFTFVPYTELGSLAEDDQALDLYLDELAAAYDFDALRRLRVIVDCCNGTSSLILRRLRERFRLDLILINERMESVQFAHEPSTNARMVGLQLAPLVRPVNAAAGFLFDVDSDRVAMATEQGDPVSEEMVLPLLADFLLPRSAGKLVITNLSSTALLEEVAAWHGGRVVRVPVGRQAAMDALSSYRPEQVALAGEGTGAVMMARFRFIYDGIASMLAILSMMVERGKPLSAILAAYPRYSMLKAQVPLVTQRIPALLMDLQQTYSTGTANVTDGLRVDWPGRWFHVRVSQTESVVRIIAEQRGDPPRALFDALMDRVGRMA